MIVTPKVRVQFLAVRPKVEKCEGYYKILNEDEVTQFFSDLTAIAKTEFQFHFDAFEGLVFGKSGEYKITDSNHVIVWVDAVERFDILTESAFNTTYEVVPDANS